MVEKGQDWTEKEIKDDSSKVCLASPRLEF